MKGFDEVQGNAVTIEKKKWHDGLVGASLGAKGIVSFCMAEGGTFFFLQCVSCRVGNRVGAISQGWHQQANREVSRTKRMPNMAALLIKAVLVPFHIDKL